MRINTKEKRTALLDHIKESRLTKGFNLETYKGLLIFTSNANNMILLEVYRDNSTKPVKYIRYHSEERRTAAIQETKDSYDRTQDYKAKRKTEQKGRLTGAAACADAIRAELKTAFPGVKFSVRSSTFSMGDSVHISWTDGPATKDVELISGKYQAGTFNGMDDIYEYSENPLNLPRAKYVHESRTTSEETTNFLKPLLAALAPHLDSGDWSRDGLNDILAKLIRKTSFPVGATLKGIEHTDINCAVYTEDFYKITFNLPEVPTSTQAEERPAPVNTVKGEIKVISYSEKAIAVLGEGTKDIKDELYKLGGKFNKYLSCGAGWIFSKKKADEVIEFLKGLKAKQDEVIGGLKEEIQKTEEFIETLAPVQEPVKLLQAAPQAARPQQVEVKTYNSMEEINQAAESGEIISLMNLFDLVQAKERRSIN